MTGRNNFKVQTRQQNRLIPTHAVPCTWTRIQLIVIINIHSACADQSHRARTHSKRKASKSRTHTPPATRIRYQTNKHTHIHTSAHNYTRGRRKWGGGDRGKTDDIELRGGLVCVSEGPIAVGLRRDFGAKSGAKVLNKRDAHTHTHTNL